MLGGGGGNRAVGSSGGGAAGHTASDDGGGTEANTNIFSTSTSNIHNNNYSAGEDDKSGVNDGGGGSNRWPRQETLALLQIRSDMDVAFRDASPKGPFWEEVSRKLAALGYHRNAKKCKEKFENVYKYHKRTKDVRPGKHDGKTYKFFDQLKALENHNSPISSSAAAPPLPPPNHPNLPPAVTIPPSTSIPSFAQNTVTIQPPPSQMNANIPLINPIPPKAYFSDPVSNSISTSSSTSSDVELGGRRGKRKRKWEDFFTKLMMEVNDKQEEMQRKFLEAIDKRERERISREEAWRMQEMARINREHEIIAQERSKAAAKDAAVMSFLQKISTPGQPVQQPPPPPAPAQQQRVPAQQQQVALPSKDDSSPKYNQNTSSSMVQVNPSNPSRWPKVEIEALIKIRTNLDSKYQEHAPKGPLWEEISAAMKRLGYNRYARRCKEKWENINKYFKKVKESNKKRPEDSKTCPYFYQLDALYREKDKLMKAENSVALMVRPEQQWPPLGSSHPSSEPEHRHDLGLEEMESEREDDGGDEEEDGGGDRFEIVASKRVSMGASGE